MDFLEWSEREDREVKDIKNSVKYFHNIQKIFSSLQEVQELYGGRRHPRKAAPSVPHDLGDPAEEPWVKVRPAGPLSLVEILRDTAL